MDKTNKNSIKNSASQSGDEFREIFNQSPIGIIFFNKEGNVTNANKSALEILGVPKLDDILGHNLFDYPLIVEKKEELFNEGIINFNAPLDLKKLEDYGFYSPTKDDVLFLDYIVSVTDSGFLVQFQDVTEHKKAEGELHESEKNFKSILEAFPEGAFLIDAEGNIKIANKTLAKRFDKDLDKIAGLNIYDLLPPEVAKKRKEVVEQAIRTKEPITYVDIRDGVYIKSYVHPILNGKGEVSKLAVTAEDITTRKKAEMALRESEAELARAQHIAHIGSYKWDLIKDKVKWSDESYRLLGMKPGELEPNYELFLDLIVPEDRDKVNDAIKRSIDTGENYSLTYNIIGKDGIPRILLSENEIIKDEYGNVIRMYGTNQDITERKQMEGELRHARDTLEEKVKERTKELEKAYESLSESEEKFRLIFDEADDSITLSELMENGLPGKIIEANEATTKRLGYTKEELLNMTPVNIIAPESRAEMPKYAEKLKREGYAIFEIVHMAKNGRRIPVEVNNHIIKFKGKKTALAVVRDITERNKMEKQLKETIQELERSNHELRSFTYITSHDLQEPLRTMGSFAGLLKRRYGGRLDSDADDFLEYMENGAKRMKDMIQGLLDYSRVGTKEVEFKRFDSENALNSALTNLKYSIDDCNAEVTHDPLPEIFADQNQISRVFQNLISNALKFRRKGVDPNIHISASKNVGEYVFSVSDNGIGLETQYSDKIFEIFKRLHAVGDFQGAGIGLAIVKRIIDVYGGRIWVESELGVGSTFYFTIPIN